MEYKNKLVSGSYTQSSGGYNIYESIFLYSDVVLLHHYGNDKTSSFDDRYPMAYVSLGAYGGNKPVIFDETGGNAATGGGWLKADYCSDNPLHNTTWTTAFMGCFGAGQYWNWHVLSYQGYFDNFKGLSTFLEGENFANDQYREERWTDNEWAYNENTKYEAFYLRDYHGFAGEGSDKAIGWLHNTSFYWGNLGPVNSCIFDCLDDNKGVNIPGLTEFSVKDSVPYRDLRNTNFGDTSLLYYGGYKLKIPDLKAEKRYEIEWYNTRTGLSTGITQVDWSNLLGVAKFDIPGSGTELTPGYGDLAFKIRRYNTSSMLIGTDSSTAETEEEQDKEIYFVRLYPNPASNLLYLESNGTIRSAKIYTVHGELVDQFNVNYSRYSHPVNLQTGCYFVKILLFDGHYQTIRLEIIQ